MAEGGAGGERVGRSTARSTEEESELNFTYPGYQPIFDLLNYRVVPANTTHPSSYLPERYVTAQERYDAAEKIHLRTQISKLEKDIAKLQHDKNKEAEDANLRLLRMTRIAKDASGNAACAAKAELEQQKRIVEQTNEELNIVRNVVKKVTVELEREKSTAKHLRKELNSKTTQVSHFTRVLEEKQAVLNECNKKNLKLQEDITETKKEYCALKTLSSELNDENKQLTDEITELNEKLQMAETQLHEMRSNYTQLQILSDKTSKELMERDENDIKAKSDEQLLKKTLMEKTSQLEKVKMDLDRERKQKNKMESLANTYREAIQTFNMQVTEVLQQLQDSDIANPQTDSSETPINSILSTLSTYVFSKLKTSVENQAELTKELAKTKQAIFDINRQLFQTKRQQRLISGEKQSASKPKPPGGGPSGVSASDDSSISDGTDFGNRAKDVQVNDEIGTGNINSFGNSYEDIIPPTPPRRPTDDFITVKSISEKGANTTASEVINHPQLNVIKPRKKVLKPRQKKYNFVCTYCPNKFKSKDLRNNHIRNVHKRIVRTKPRFCCQICSSKFYTKEQLEAHSSAIHGPTTQRPRMMKTRSTTRMMNGSMTSMTATNTATKTAKQPNSLHKHQKNTNVTKRAKTTSTNETNEGYRPPKPHEGSAPNPPKTQAIQTLLKNDNDMPEKKAPVGTIETLTQRRIVKLEEPKDIKYIDLTNDKQTSEPILIDLTDDMEPQDHDSPATVQDPKTNSPSSLTLFSSLGLKRKLFCTLCGKDGFKTEENLQGHIQNSHRPINI